MDHITAEKIFIEYCSAHDRDSRLALAIVATNPNLADQINRGPAHYYDDSFHLLLDIQAGRFWNSRVVVLGLSPQEIKLLGENLPAGGKVSSIDTSILWIKEASKIMLAAPDTQPSRIRGERFDTIIVIRPSNFFPSALWEEVVAGLGSCISPCERMGKVRSGVSGG